MRHHGTGGDEMRAHVKPVGLVQPLHADFLKTAVDPDAGMAVQYVDAAMCGMSVGDRLL